MDTVKNNNDEYCCNKQLCQMLPETTMTATATMNKKMEGFITMAWWVVVAMVLEALL